MKHKHSTRIWDTAALGVDLSQEEMKGNRKKPCWTMHAQLGWLPPQSHHEPCALSGPGSRLAFHPGRLLPPRPGQLLQSGLLTCRLSRRDLCPRLAQLLPGDGFEPPSLCPNAHSHSSAEWETLVGRPKLILDSGKESLLRSGGETQAQEHYFGEMS